MTYRTVSQKNQWEKTNMTNKKLIRINSHTHTWQVVAISGQHSRVYSQCVLRTQLKLCDYELECFFAAIHSFT